MEKSSALAVKLTLYHHTKAVLLIHLIDMGLKGTKDGEWQVRILAGKLIEN